MATPSIKFKKLLFANDKNTRGQILQPLMQWMMDQMSHDSKAGACYNSLQEAYSVNSWAETKAFKDHYLWFMMPNHDTCVSFQEIVKSKLAVPKKNMVVAIKDLEVAPRKNIPKKIRGEAWKNQFGDLTSGRCYCCKSRLDAFSDWHAGHIISHANGGPDTAENLKVVCSSCNLSMGTENMEAFKTRCYP